MRSKSPAAVPILAAPEKDEELLIWVKDRQLNAVALNNRNPTRMHSKNGRVGRVPGQVIDGTVAQKRLNGWKDQASHPSCGSALNLIALRLVERTGLTRTPYDFNIVHITNGTETKLSACCRLKVTVEGVSQIVKACIVTYETSHSLLLGRVWMRIDSTIGDYRNNDYWKGDDWALGGS